MSFVSNYNLDTNNKKIANHKHETKDKCINLHIKTRIHMNKMTKCIEIINIQLNRNAMKNKEAKKLKGDENKCEACK